MTLEQQIKDKALDLGADFAGIACGSRFERAPDFSRPENVLPGFKSVIVFGIAMNRGGLKAWFSKTSRRPLVLQNKLATSELDRISLHLSRWLERQGHDADFISQNGQYNLFRGRPDFSHKHAAAAAGLGSIGLSSNFVHSKYGSAVHLSSIITAADLDPDPLLDPENTACTKCKSCIEICPVQAIQKDREKSFHMDGHEFTHQWVDKLRCGWGCAGLCGREYQIGSKTVGTWSYNDMPIPEDAREFGIKFIEADHYQRHPKELAENVISGGTEYCGNCLKVCVGSKKDTAAMLKLHLNSGLVDIPNDRTLVLNLDSANHKLEQYRIPKEEIDALYKS